MPEQFCGKILLWKSYENDLKTGDASHFHCRKTIGVASDQYDPVQGTIGGIARDIETEPHVHALLFELRLEISVRQRVWVYGRSSRHKPPEFQNTKPHGELRFGGKNFEPFIRAVEIGWLTGHGKFRVPLIGRTVVVKDAEQGFILRNTSERNSFDVVGIVSVAGLSRQEPEVAAVNEDCRFQRNESPLQRKKPLTAKSVRGLRIDARLRALRIIEGTIAVTLDLSIRMRVGPASIFNRRPPDG